jgi:hypothetical protein
MAQGHISLSATHRTVRTEGNQSLPNEVPTAPRSLGSIKEPLGAMEQQKSTL